MLDFIQRLPFAQIAAATADARRYKLSGNRLLETLPEAMPVMEAYEDYQRRQTALVALAARIPSP
jgi:hypothetical protein